MLLVNQLSFLRQQASGADYKHGDLPFAPAEIAFLGLLDGASLDLIRKVDAEAGMASFYTDFDQGIGDSERLEHHRICVRMRSNPYGCLKAAGKRFGGW
jgi:hypothetical protein